MAFLAIVVRTKRAGAEGAPARKGGERHHRRSSGGGRGWNQGAPGERAGRQGRSPAPRPARHSHRAWLSAQPFPSSQPLYFYSLFPYYYYYYFFPRKAGTRDCPSEPRRGRHFSGEAQRASAPSAPEREPEGSARPRALLRAGPGLTAARGARPAAQQPPALASAARVPGLTFAGAARPRTPVPSLRPAPPHPSIVSPSSRRPAPAPRSPPPPGSNPSAAGRLPPPSSAPQTPHPQEPAAPSWASLARGRAPDSRPFSSLPHRQDALGSSPAAGILPLL